MVREAAGFDTAGDLVSCGEWWWPWRGCRCPARAAQPGRHNEEERMGREDQRTRQDATGGGEEEFEPDYRFTLANERTFLAWLRTALALLAASVAVVQLVPEFAFPAARHIVGGLLAALAVVTAATGLRRWERVDYAIRRGLPLPRPQIPRVLTAGLVLIAVFGVVLVITNAVR
jgi:putative membrane protein